MIRIITKSRLEDLERYEHEANKLVERIESLHFFKDLTFMKNLAKWLRTGYCYCGEFYNCSAHNIRRDLQIEVDTYFQNELSKQREEIERYKKENDELSRTIEILRRLDRGVL